MARWAWFCPWCDWVSPDVPSPNGEGWCPVEEHMIDLHAREHLMNQLAKNVVGAGTLFVPAIFYSGRARRRW